MARKAQKSGSVSSPSSSRPIQARNQGAIGAAAARRAAIEALPDVLHRSAADRVPASKPRTRQRQERRETVVLVERPERRKKITNSPREAGTLRDGETDKKFGDCKKRPSSSKGSGKGRPFVPWCK